MELIIKKIGSVTLIAFSGNYLDAGNCDEFKRSIEPLLASNHLVILDLDNLKFVDSSGLGALLFCQRKLAASHGDLRLCGMCRPVRTPFELVRMHRLIDVFDNREDALASFEK